LAANPLIRQSFIAGIFIIANLETFAQNLETVGKEKPFSISGGISASQIFYGASGIKSRRDPYSYYLSGNLNIGLYGWSVPLNFSYSNQNFSYQQPFNQYAIHPTYKWITGHFGYTSMSYSSYTVNGHNFLGAGIDVAPEGKWKLSALYGRFLKAVDHDTTKNTSVVPAFQRMGCGFKASYGEGGNFADLIFFHAKDEISSIGPVPDSLNILPQENLVVNMAVGKTFFKHFILRTEFATSALSRDTRAAGAIHSHPLAKTRLFYEPRLSSSFYNAFKTSFDFQQESYTLGIAYERIDPQYRTLGAYFFNNDLENLTANVTTAIMQNKMNIAASAGMQRDNLDRSKISTMTRMVGAVNVNYLPSEKLNISGSYSTFQSYTNIRSQFVDINRLTPYQNLYTLKFTQLSSNASLTATLSFAKNEQRKQNINFALTYQNAADRQGALQQNAGMKFYNFNTAYALSLVPKQITIAASINTTLNEGIISSKTMGPTLAINKSLLEKKLRVTLSSSYNNTYVAGENAGTILSSRVNAGLVLKKKHNITLSMSMISRHNNTQEINRSFTEYTCSLGYSYAFGTK
jgi:hypothetical protein